MIMLETQAALFILVPCFIVLNFSVVDNRAGVDFALTLCQQCRRDNKHSSLSVGQFLVACLMVSLLLHGILKLNFL
jgi:hypothetical protein